MSELHSTVVAWMRVKAANTIWNGFSANGFWIPFLAESWIPKAGFWIPKLSIPDSTSKISLIPESGFPYMGRFGGDGRPCKWPIISRQALIIIRSKRNTFIIRTQNKRKSSLKLKKKNFYRSLEKVTKRKLTKLKNLQCKLTSVAGRYNSLTLLVSRFSR